MKKLLLSLLVLVASMSVMAEMTAKAQLTLSSQSGQTCVTTLIEKSELNAGLNKGYCAEIKMEDRVVALYAIFDGKNYQTFGTKDLEGLAFGIMTDVATEYTISFSNVQGTLYLVDAVANKTTKITAGGSYAFTAEANQTIADRFSITKVAPLAPYSFINNRLVINDAAVGAEVNVTPFSFVEGRRVDGQKVIYNAPVNQLLNGNYFEVEYTNKNGVARKFIVNANPTIVLANP